MNYSLHQLHVFQKVVDNKSITRASEQLNMTQPAVSIQLKNLQQQFEIPLTEVIGRQLYITDFGMKIYEIAGRILEDVERIDAQRRAFKGLLQGRLRVASVSTGKYVFPYYLTDFLKTYPDVVLELDVTNKQEVVEALDNNQVDFAFLTMPPEQIQLEKKVLMANYLFLIGASDHAFAQQKRLSQRWWNELPLIYREKGSGTRHQMENYFNEKQLHPSIRSQLKSNEAVKQALMAGLGFSIISLVSLKNELALDQLKIIKVNDLPLESDWQLVWRKQKMLTPVAAAFLEYVEKENERIYKEHFAWQEAYL